LDIQAEKRAAWLKSPIIQRNKSVKSKFLSSKNGVDLSQSEIEESDYKSSDSNDIEDSQIHDNKP
jgi:hypothetical protein